MARFITANYSWEFADVGGDIDTWGILHQTAWAAIDSQVKVNEDAIAAVAAGALPLAGGTMAGLLTTLVSGTGGAGFNLPEGVAPTAPVDGDLWLQNDGLYIRLQGVTYLLTVLGHTHDFDVITGQITTAQIEDDAVTLAKQAPGTADVLQGFDENGDPSEIVAGAGVTVDAGVLDVDIPYGGFTEYNLGTYANSSTYSQAHGLTGYPSDIRAFIKCTIPDLNYAVGDMVPLESLTDEGGGNRMPGVYMNTTNVIFVTSTFGPQLVQADNGSSSDIAESSWDVVLRVFP